MEAYFDEVLARIEKNKQLRESGKQVCIPYPFKRLTNVLPGIEKGQHIGLTAGTGVAKSKLSRFLFIYSVYEYIKENPECGIKPVIFYFILENSLQEVMDEMICHRLKKAYKIDIDSKILNSKKAILSNEVLAKIIESREYFKDLGNYLHIIHNVHNPFGIYKEVRAYMRDNGTVHTEKKPNEQGELVDIPVRYEPNDLETHVIVLVDNLNNIQKEKNHESKWVAMKDWTANYARMNLCKFYNCTVITIQQQDLDSQKLTFSSYQGEAIKGKVVPSVATLAENKTTSQDFHLIFGIFHPRLYKFDTDLGYDLDLLEDSYRNLSILKSNDTGSGFELGLYFNGASETFIELPHPKLEARALNEFYENFRKKYNK